MAYCCGRHCPETTFPTVVEHQLKLGKLGTIKVAWQTELVQVPVSPDKV
jgi:hypothetical protein